MGTVAHIIGIALVVIGAAAIAFVTGVLREHYRQILERQRAAFEEAADPRPDGSRIDFGDLVLIGAVAFLLALTWVAVAVWLQP